MTAVTAIDADIPPLVAETQADAAEVAAFVDQAFGPGRFAKTAERLREGNRPLLSISRVARSGGAVVGCVRMWPIHLSDRPAVFLGPFAVDEAWRSRGLGGALIRAACEAAEAEGHTLVVLVGDYPYFQRFGFQQIPAGAVVLPGPVDPRRVLVKALKPGAADGLTGSVRVG